MEHLLSNFRLQDAVDIGIIAFIVYRIIDLIRGTRAARMLLGLVVVFLVFLSSQFFDLYTLNWILDNFLSSILLIIVVIFQHDIRRALTQVGSGPFFGSDPGMQGQDVEEIVRAVVALASKRIGGLIVFERDVGLNEYIEGGTKAGCAHQPRDHRQHLSHLLADSRRRDHRPQGAGRRGGLLPAVDHQSQRQQDAGHASPCRHRPDRGDGRGGDRRVRGRRSHLAGARRALDARSGRREFARAPTEAAGVSDGRRW